MRTALAALVVLAMLAGCGRKAAPEAPPRVAPPDDVLMQQDDDPLLEPRPDPTAPGLEEEVDEELGL